MDFCKRKLVAFEKLLEKTDLRDWSVPHSRTNSHIVKKIRVDVPPHSIDSNLDCTRHSTQKVFSIIVQHDSMQHLGIILQRPALRNDISQVQC